MQRNCALISAYWSVYLLENSLESVMVFNATSFDHFVDAKALACPMPLLKTKQALKNMQVGQVVLVQTLDAGSWRDIPLFAQKSGHELLFAQQEQGVFCYLIKKVK